MVLQAPAPWFDPKVTLGNILVAASFLFAGLGQIAAALLAWRDINWRLKNVEEWQKDHEASCMKQDEILDEMRLAVRELTTLSGQHERRLGNVEGGSRERGSEHRR